MHLVGYDYNDYDCFQVGLKKKKNSYRKEKSQYSLKEKNIFCHVYLTPSGKRLLAVVPHSSSRACLQKKEKEKKKNIIASQRFGLEYLLLFPMPPRFSTMFISIFQALYEHFACLSTLLNVTLLPTASHVFQPWPRNETLVHPKGCH